MHKCFIALWPVGSNDNHLYAIDAVTGKEKWRFTTGAAGGVISGDIRWCCLCLESG